MTNDKLSTIDQVTQEIERVLEQCNVATLKEMAPLRQAVVLATGMTQLRKALTNEVVQKVFMPLKDSPLGFLTDEASRRKDNLPPYGVEDVREIMVECLVNGFQPINDEINIISRRMYGAKNGYARKVRELPGLTDLVITPGVPALMDKGALVPMRARWRVNGTPHEMVRDVSKTPDGVVHDTRIPVRVNAGMGADAIAGKATRKMLKAIYDAMTGSALTTEDGEVGEAIDTDGVVVDPTPAPAPPEQDGKRVKVGQNKKHPAEHTVGIAQSVTGTAESPAAESTTTREPGQEG